MQGGGQVTRIRAGILEHGDTLVSADECSFCGERALHGAVWMGFREVVVCSLCALDGQLGKLLGDSARDVASLERALQATALEAWRALALAKERAS